MPETQHELNETVFTADELAERLKLHPATIRRMFIDEPGVIRLGRPGNKNRRQHYSLRIPMSVVQRVVGRLKVA